MKANLNTCEVVDARDPNFEAVRDRRQFVQVLSGQHRGAFGVFGIVDIDRIRKSSG